MAYNNLNTFNNNYNQLYNNHNLMNNGMNGGHMNGSNNHNNNSMYRIPNRIFVGGIPQTASQNELREYFSHFGHVKDARIITDPRGNSKGYGFVTYNNEIDASKVLSVKEEDLIFKENKLNIGHAFRKKNNMMMPNGNAAAAGGFNHNHNHANSSSHNSSNGYLEAQMHAMQQQQQQHHHPHYQQHGLSGINGMHM